MREHQIVITLKPDQFLEVQRLARAANAKSMGVFVRQKLLAALGIEGSLADERITGADGADVDLDEIVADLKRMHGELKAFVAESLSPYAAEAFGQSEQAPDDDSEQLNVFQMVDEVEDPLVSQAVADVESIHNDELEKVADRTFAISPRLGSIAEPSVTQQQSPQSSIAETKNLLSRHEMHYRRDVHRYQQPADSNSFMDESFEDEGPLPVMPPPAVPSVNHTNSAVDPLSKLLSSDDLIKKPIPKTTPLDDDDEEFNVPLSIAERRRMLGDGEPEQAPVYQHPPHPALEPTLPSDMPERQAADAQQTPIPAENFTEPVSEPDAQAESGSMPASQPPPPPQNELGRPLGYPPLSGSPPPKRRQL
jgi:hypothetical protein